MTPQPITQRKLAGLAITLLAMVAVVAQQPGDTAIKFVVGAMGTAFGVFCGAAAHEQYHRTKMAMSSDKKEST